jgi:hypothetical protein
MADAIYNPPLKAATAERTRQPKTRPADLPQGQQKIRRRNRTIASCKGSTVYASESIALTLCRLELPPAQVEMRQTSAVW